MTNKLFVRNLSYNTSETALEELFAGHGKVVSTVIPKDRDTGRPRGFAFVEMASQAEAEAAINALNNRQLDGREIFVAVSESQDSKRGSSAYRNRY